MKQVRDIPIDQIRAQIVDREVTEEGVIQLAKSIKQVGILEPLLVVHTTTGYVLQAGKRRLMAAKMADLPTVPCIVVEADKDRSFAITMHENLYREQLNAVDEAYMYQQLRDAHRYSQEEIAKLVGKSDGYISQRLSIILWPDNLRDALHKDHISFSVARELSKVRHTKTRNWLIRNAVDQGANYRTVRRWVAQYSVTPQEDTPQPDYAQPPPPPTPPQPVKCDCWWCENTVPEEHTVQVRFCHQCFGALQLNKDDTAKK